MQEIIEDINDIEYMKDWKEVRLGDVAEILTGYPFKSIMYSNEGKLRVVRGDNVTERELRWGEKTRFWNNNTEGLEKFFLEENDIVIGMDGSKVGKNKAMVKKNDLPLILAQRVACIRAKSGISQKYLSHQILNDKFLNYVESIKTGTSIPHISLKQIADFKMSLPKYEIQQKIAQILSSLDDKIELNNAINKNLEEIAQTLFKQWFVDFEFPNDNGEPYKSSGGEMIESELGLIPKGWRVGILEDIANITMGQSPSGSSYNENSEGVIFYQGRTDFGSRYPSVRLYTTEPKRMANEGDILLSVRAPVGDINIANDNCCIGRGLASISSDNKSYLLYSLMNLKASFNIYNGEGTVFGSINKDALNNLKIIIPTNEIRLLFERKIGKLDESYHNNFKETQTLTKLRDELLPKLMSGEVRV